MREQRCEARVSERDGSLFRERLLPLLYRRFTFILYRSSPRYRDYVHRVGPGRVVSVPRYPDAITYYLAQRLPSPIVARIGEDGLLILSERLHRVCSVLGAAARVVAKPMLLLLRGLVGHLRRRSAVCQHSVLRAPVNNVRTLLGGAIRVEGFAVQNDVLELYLRRVGRVRNHCQIFVHLRPEKRSVLPWDRVRYGFFCKDHDPPITLPSWPKGRTLRDRTDLSDLPSGLYRVSIGVIDVVTLQCMEDYTTCRPSVDLGWIGIRGRPVQPESIHAMLPASRARHDAGTPEIVIASSGSSLVVPGAAPRPLPEHDDLFSDPRCDPNHADA